MKPLATFLGYLVLWVVPRWPAIRANALFGDDFGVPAHAAALYVGPFRPLLYAEYLLWETIRPGHFWTVWPKIMGAIYFALAATVLAALLRRWSLPAPIAYLLPAALLAHPVLNDAGLWSIVHGLGLALALITAGVFVWTDRRFVLGTVLILAGVLGYQIYISVAVALLAVEWILRRETRASLTKLALVALIAVLQIATMQLIRATTSFADHRGLVATFDLSAKVHGAVDMIANAYMPVVAYYTGAPAAWSLWKWIPLTLALATALVLFRHPRTLPVAALPLALPLLAAAPTFLLSQSPYAWRVSVVAVYAALLSAIPLLTRLRFSAVLLVAIIALLLPPTHTESRLRAERFLQDEHDIAAIERHWLARGVPRDQITIAVARPPHVDTSLHPPGPVEFTWGYERFSPMQWSPYTNGWVAEKYVSDYHGLRFAEMASPLCRGGKEHFVHDEERRITVQCPRSDLISESAMETVTSRSSSQ